MCYRWGEPGGYVQQASAIEDKLQQLAVGGARESLLGQPLSRCLHEGGAGSPIGPQGIQSRRELISIFLMGSV